MTTERLSMRSTRESLRQKWPLGRSHREVAASLGLSVGVIAATLQRARAAGLDWAAVEGLDELTLEARLYGARVIARRPVPDPAYLHTERKKPGVTLELLHQEYLAQHPDGYQYTQFCDYYRRWCQARRLSMRQVHRAGEKLFVDYSGTKPTIVDPATGEVRAVELFVAVFGASNYTFAEATATQQVADWLGSHVRAFEFFGGLPAVVVPDQLKTGVTGACRYEPTLQRSYEELAAHYGTAILPARPARPRDKAKVEVGVQVAQRWILARLRHETFVGLGALNRRIRELLDELNHRQMRHYRTSRQALFVALDQPALQPLPATRFEPGAWKWVRANIDYHVELEGHYYSVPFTLRQERLELRSTPTTIEIFHHGHRVASHVRQFVRGRHTTVSAHMPHSHQQHLAWTPARLIRWGRTLGPAVEALVTTMLDARAHPEQGYRSCLGLLRLGKQYGEERLDAACARALAGGARSYRHVASILKTGLDRLAASSDGRVEQPALRHDHLRGSHYYR
jgi:transposase